LIKGNYLAVVVHDNTTRILFSSLLAQELLGLTEEQMLGKTTVDPAWHFFDEDGAVLPQEEYPVNKVMTTHQGLLDMVIGVHRPGKNNVWILVSAHPVFEEQGEVSQVIVTFIDITERKQTEEALRESANLHKSIITTSADGFWLLDNNGNFLEVNDAYCQMIGYTRAELLQMSISDIEASETSEEIAKNIKSVIEKGFDRFERTHRCKDGRLIEVEVSTSFLELLEGQFCAFIRDITEHKQAEGELKFNRYYLEKAQEISSLGSWELDLRINKLVWTDENYRVFGVPLGTELTYEIFLNCVHPEDREYVDRKWKAALAGEPYDIEHRLIVDGQVRWVREKAEMEFDGDGKAIKGIGFTQNITKQKQAEDELRESEEQHRALIENVNDIILILDKNGVILWSSPVVRKFGMDPEEAIGENALNFIHPDDRDRVELTRKYCIEHPGETITIEGLKVISGDGRLLFLDDTVIYLPDTPGINGIIITGHDVTERVQLEEERTKGAKLESIGLLAGGIAHDFNNILTTILTNVSLAKMMLEGEGSDDARERLTQSEQAGRRAAALTQQLLTFSRGGAPVKKTAMLGDIVKESTGFALSGSNVKCRHYIDKDLWPCSVDSGQISQVINNLVINADQAMPEGGVIEIRVKNVVVSSKDALPLEEGKYVRVTVKDQGIGISKQHISKIFDPYYTTKQKGSGLGLATCYSIVVRHDGHIAVESEPGVGTSFHIYLPATPGRVRKKGKEKGKAALPAGRVLVMDDEPTVLEAAVLVLESLGQEAQGAADGSEAVKLYKRAMKSGKPFDAVILDLTVPGGMGGRETVEKLQKIDPEIKAIVSSGYSNDPVMANFKEYGFSGVVSKPYQIEEIKNVLHGVMKKNG